jgi:predicted anti-sigma-YlaC factor YlaD
VTDRTPDGSAVIADADPERTAVAALRLLGVVMLVVALGLWPYTAAGLRWTPASLVVGGVVPLTLPDIAVEQVAS